MIRGQVIDRVPPPANDEELLIGLSSSQLRRYHRVNDEGASPAYAAMAALNATATATAPPPPLPPQRDKVRTEQRIGAYNILRTLGEGSFGKVKLAVHRSTGQQVALKIIARKKLISRDMQGRVEREIEYLQLLRHPHIIKL